MKILVVEDDRHLLEAIVSVLKEESYQVDQTDDGLQGYQMAETGCYDLLVLDVMLPGMDGFTMIRKLRSQSVTTPALFLTAKDNVESRVQGLDAGADDYLVKPFAVEELLARIRALLRRFGKGGMELSKSYGKITLPAQEYEAYIDGKPLHLTVKEYELLDYLVTNRERILTREQIFTRVWGFDSDTSDAIVELYIHYLRKKLAPFGCDKWIRTVRGVGYMLKEEPNTDV
jgi:two-component system, OmpR family, response regulator CiaR